MQTSIPSLRYFTDPYLLLRHSLLVNLLFLLPLTIQRWVCSQPFRQHTIGGKYHHFTTTNAVGSGYLLTFLVACTSFQFTVLLFIPDWTTTDPHGSFVSKTSPIRLPRLSRTRLCHEGPDWHLVSIMPRYPISICIVPRGFTNRLREWGSPVLRWLEAGRSFYWFADLRSRLLFGYPMPLSVLEIYLSERRDSFIML